MNTMGGAAKRGAADGPIDRGLAGERTTLAWHRSALALAGTGALLMRLGAETPVPALGWVLGWAFGAADVLVAATLWLHEERVRRVRPLALADQGFLPDALLLKLLSLAAVASAVGGISLALVQ